MSDRASVIVLTPPGPDDVEALLAFELENRAFFEARINARPASYYSHEGVADAIAAAIRDAQADIAHQFLIRDAAGAIVGRVNLTRIRRTHFHSAEIGYRIGEAHNGRGYARDAVRTALEYAFDTLRLQRVEAVASPENAGSIRVLARNGFVQYGHSRRSFQLDGRWYDTLHFERHADGAPPATQTENR